MGNFLEPENPITILGRIDKDVREVKSLMLDLFNRFKPPQEDIQITSLKQLAEVLDCSLPKAQSVKNSLPSGSFFQQGRKFSISRNWLLHEWPKLQANRGK